MIDGLPLKRDRTVSNSHIQSKDQVHLQSLFVGGPFRSALSCTSVMLIGGRHPRREIRPTIISVQQNRHHPITIEEIHGLGCSSCQGPDVAHLLIERDEGVPYYQYNC